MNNQPKIPELGTKDVKPISFSGVDGKVVIVTGASRGIGEAIAKLYGAHGMKVVCANRDPKKGQAVADEIVSAGGTAVFCQTDTSKAESIKSMVDFAVATYGRLDGIVNNAGMGMGGTPMHENSIEDCEQIMDLNILGVFAGMKYAVEAMLKSGPNGAFIINIASIAGIMAQSGMGLYAASKHSVVALTKAAALEYAPYGITVNAICPGHTYTSIYGMADEGTLNTFADQVPVGRMGNPMEDAALALFLASDHARFITGAIIPVDGGTTAGQPNIVMWRHPEILNGGDVVVNSDSTIAVILETPGGKELVDKFLPGFTDNEQAKQAYGMTFKQILTLPMTASMPQEYKDMFVAALDALGKK